MNLIICNLLIASLSFYSASGLWHTSFEDAQINAQEESVPILMVFSGSDWCKPCIRLKREVFETETFISFAKDNLSLLVLDFPRYKKNKLEPEVREHHESLAGKYNPNGEFPLVVILDPDGNVIGKTGYLPGGPDAYISHIQQIIQDQSE